MIWWLLLGVLLTGFAIMDGFDLGAAIMLPFVGRTDAERRVAINTVGPVWEGNQVWLILGGGAIFAAWPALYAASFSGFYLAMLLVLAALILRPVGFKFRSKMPGARWRSTWDWLLFVGGLVPSLVFGVAMGNLLEGVPFGFDSELRAHYAFGLFAPAQSFRIAVWAGVRGHARHSWRALPCAQGRRSRGVRAASFSRWTALAWLVLFAVAGVWLARSGYRLPHCPRARWRGLRTGSAREDGAGDSRRVVQQLPDVGHSLGCFRPQDSSRRCCWPLCRVRVPRWRCSCAARSVWPASSARWA